MTLTIIVTVAILVIVVIAAACVFKRMENEIEEIFGKDAFKVTEGKDDDDNPVNQDSRVAGGLRQQDSAQR